jgi:hypothetical protein
MQPVVPGDDSAAQFLERPASLASDDHQIVGFCLADGGCDGDVTVGLFDGPAPQTRLEVLENGAHRHMAWVVTGEDHHRVIGLADLLYTRWDYEENLKMTKSEVKDERKQAEGDPMIKNKQRQKSL